MAETIYQLQMIVFVITTVHLVLYNFQRVIKKAFSPKPIDLDAFLQTRYSRKRPEYWDQQAKEFLKSGGWEDEPKDQVILWTNWEYQQLLQRNKTLDAQAAFFAKKGVELMEQLKQLKQRNQQLKDELSCLNGVGLAITQDKISVTGQQMSPGHRVTFMGMTPVEIRQMQEEWQRYKYIVESKPAERRLKEVFPGKALVDYNGKCSLVYCMHRKQIVGEVEIATSSGGSLYVTKLHDPHGLLKTLNPTAEFWEATAQEGSGIHGTILGFYKSVPEAFKAINEL